MVRSLIALAVLAFVAATAQAATNTKSEDFEACAKKAHGATFPLLHCFSEEMKAADDVVRASYKKALDQTSNATTKKFLTRAQTAWENYRDAWCEATVARSGSLARIRLLECRVDETRHRAAELAALTDPQ
jgi:uncharacterized protein YecT (DUF1311 family)